MRREPFRGGGHCLPRRTQERAIVSRAERTTAPAIADKREDRAGGDGHHIPHRDEPNDKGD